MVPIYLRDLDKDSIMYSDTIEDIKNDPKLQKALEDEEDIIVGWGAKKLKISGE